MRSLVLSKTQSLSERADMFPVAIYGEQIADIPDDLLGSKGSLTYFGSSCHLRLLEMRRKTVGVTHTESNTVAIENDNYFINSCKSKTSIAADYIVKGYKEHIEQGLDSNVKWAVRNTPYNYEGQGAARLWADIIKADNKNEILDYQSDILPISLMRGSDGELKGMRSKFLNDYGLYKVRPYPFHAFAAWNAKVATAGYFCRKGYSGDITVKTDVSTYQYDFRSRGLIVTPDTEVEVDFLFHCLDSEGYTWNPVKHEVLGFLNSKSMTIKNPKIFSFTKDDTFKYPMVIKLDSKTGYKLGYTSIIVDVKGIECDKIVIPYQCSSYASGGSELGNVVYVPAGIQLMGSYKWIEISASESNAHVNYLQSLPVKYLLANWRTSQTNDLPQLNIIPKLSDTMLTTDDDILEFLGGKSIKKEIINGYRKKTSTK